MLSHSIKFPTVVSPLSKAPETPGTQRNVGLLSRTQEHKKSRVRRKTTVMTSLGTLGPALLKASHPRTRTRVGRMNVSDL